MSDKKHNGTGHYCGECLKLIDAESVEYKHACSPEGNQETGYKVAYPGADACKHFIPSLKAQEIGCLRRIAESLENIDRQGITVFDG